MVIDDLSEEWEAMKNSDLSVVVHQADFLEADHKDLKEEADQWDLTSPHATTTMDNPPLLDLFPNPQLAFQLLLPLLLQSPKSQPPQLLQCWPDTEEDDLLGEWEATKTKDLLEDDQWDLSVVVHSEDFSEADHKDLKEETDQWDLTSPHATTTMDNPPLPDLFPNPQLAFQLLLLLLLQ